MANCLQAKIHLKGSFGLSNIIELSESTMVTYRQSGEANENRIKELNIGFGQLKHVLRPV